jgi:predicted phosphodiesterase
MRIGVLSDTHSNKKGALEHIVKEFKKRGVELIIHCGDLIPEHISGELFGGLPVICALVDDQETNSIFDQNKPENWQFTRSGGRITKLPDKTIVYVGHKRHMDFLKATEEKFNELLSDMRGLFDGLRFVFGGHLHFQTYKQGQLVSFINPGAVEDALGWGYEFAVMDTDIEEVVFSRILPTSDDRKTFSIGIISDSLDVSHRDLNFWSRLAKELKDRDVSHVIHCGNLDLCDIGREELKDFTIHYAIRSDQKYDYTQLKKNSKIPSNWLVISEENLGDGSVVDFNGYRFYVRLDLGLEFMNISELGMDSAAMKIRRQYPQTEFVLCGFTREALYVEGQHVATINPGDLNTGRSFVVVCLPRKEITFGHVPFDPLPKLSD